MNHAALESAHKGMSDAQIAQRVATGDQAAFQLLMRRHNRTLYRTARSILRDEAEAEDAVQEAYLSAYRAIGGFRDEAKLSTWLVRIVANEALARLRKRKRRAEFIQLEGDTRPEDLRTGLNTNPAAPEPPEQGALRAETRRLLEGKIDELPDAFRVVFMLRAVEELSVEETSAALAIPGATVRTRYFRARGLLRESLLRDSAGCEMEDAIGDVFAFAGGRCDRIVAVVEARHQALQASGA